MLLLCPVEFVEKVLKLHGKRLHEVLGYVRTENHTHCQVLSERAAGLRHGTMKEGSANLLGAPRPR